jgi:DNA replication protein DnaC
MPRSVAVSQASEAFDERSIRHRARQDQSCRLEDAAGAGSPRRHPAGIEHGEIGAVEAIDALLTEELTTRENRRVRMAVQMARLSAIKTLAGFDFAFQPSLDRNRILALAGLQFIDRAEALHLIGPPGTGKTHLIPRLTDHDAWAHWRVARDMMRQG